MEILRRGKGLGVDRLRVVTSRDQGRHDLIEEDAPRVVPGRVVARGITDNGWICGSRIGDSVEIIGSAHNPETASSPGRWDIGSADPNYCGDTSFDPVPGNAIGGSLIFDRNASGGALANNDIEQILTCNGNFPAPTGGSNRVDRSARGQCAGLTGGADNDTSSPGDND